MIKKTNTKIIIVAALLLVSVVFYLFSEMQFFIITDEKNDISYQVNEGDISKYELVQISAFEVIRYSISNSENIAVKRNTYHIVENTPLIRKFSTQDYQYGFYNVSDSQFYTTKLPVKSYESMLSGAKKIHTQFLIKSTEIEEPTFSIIEEGVVFFMTPEPLQEQYYMGVIDFNEGLIYTEKEISTLVEEQINSVDSIVASAPSTPEEGVSGSTFVNVTEDEIKEDIQPSPVPPVVVPPTPVEIIPEVINLQATQTPYESTIVVSWDEIKNIQVVQDINLIIDGTTTMDGNKTTQEFTIPNQTIGQHSYELQIIYGNDKILSSVVTGEVIVYGTTIVEVLNTTNNSVDLGITMEANDWTNINSIVVSTLPESENITLTLEQIELLKSGARVPITITNLTPNTEYEVIVNVNGVDVFEYTSIKFTTIVVNDADLSYTKQYTLFINTKKIKIIDCIVDKFYIFDFFRLPFEN